MKRFQIYLSLLLAASISLNAQWSFSSSVSQEYDSNPFHSPVEFSSYITSFSLGAENSTGFADISYFGNYNDFQAFSDANYYWHQIAFYLDTDSISWGFMADNRLNSSATSYLNYFSGEAYFSTLFNYSDIYWKFGSSVNLMQYSEMTDLNNAALNLYFKGIKSFETRTTFIIGVETNYKYYTDQNKISGSTNSSLWQLALNSRVSQSLHTNWGIAGYYNKSFIMNDPGINPLRYESGYGDESIYFDDPAASEGYRTGISLTGKLPYEITIRSGYNYYSSNYVSQPIYTDQESIDYNVLRSDTKQTGYIGISKDLNLDSGGNYSLSLSTRYLITNNASNSYWFNYKSNSIIAGIDFYF